MRDKTITEQTFDQRTQAKRVAEASVAAQEAAVRQAELDLEFTELRAPVAGRIGDRRVSPGNLVTGGTGGNTTLLATIVSLDPIRFEFTLDEASYLRYERLAGATATTSTSRGGSVPVALKLIDETDFAHDGRMDFVDNAIDRSHRHHPRPRRVRQSRTACSRPACSARVRVPGSPPTTALLVPDAAIGTEQARKFVLVVDGEQRRVRRNTSRSARSSTACASIKDGLDAPTTRVIVNGLMRVRPGAKVTPQEPSGRRSRPRRPAGARTK